MGDKPVRSVQSAAYDSLIELVKALRAESGLTQVELCRRLGQNVAYVSKIELGTRRLDVVEFIELVRAMGFDPAKAFARLLSQT